MEYIEIESLDRIRGLRTFALREKPCYVCMLFIIQNGQSVYYIGKLYARHYKIGKNQRSRSIGLSV